MQHHTAHIWASDAEGPVRRVRPLCALLDASKERDDPTIVNVYYYYSHPSAPATWVKGDSVSHADLSRAMNEGAR